MLGHDEMNVSLLSSYVLVAVVKRIDPLFVLAFGMELAGRGRLDGWTDGDRWRRKSKLQSAEMPESFSEVSTSLSIITFLIRVI